MVRISAAAQSVAYTPAGRGYTVMLDMTGGPSITITRTSPDAEVEVVADSDPTGNLALVASLTAFGDAELAFRRARSADKRKSFRRTADEAQAKAFFIGRLIEELTDECSQGWCSACFQLTEHRRSRWHNRPKPTNLCTSCGAPTTRCAKPGCPHFATVWSPGTTQSLRYCAEHKHEIPSFTKLQEHIRTIDEYPEWLRFEAANASGITKVAAVTIGGVAVVAPLMFVAAPLIGGALGASALGGSLTGAAATSHGLAMLGGGALAAGGFGMAGGTAVVTATGAALGGVLGGTVASSYTRQDKSFAIEKLRDGEGPAVLLSWGWLSENKSGEGHFERLLDEHFPASPVYRIHWGAKEIKDFGGFLSIAATKQAVPQVVKELAKHAIRAGGKLGPLSAVFAAADIAANPWTVATNRATMTGAVLADAIARTEHESFILIGHSLGARVMVSAAQALGTRAGSPKIDSMHLLGAALSTRQDWRTLSQSVSGNIWNYHSRKDPVLKFIYRVGEVGHAAVGGVGFGTSFANIKDRDVSKLVNGHWDYFTEIALAS